MFSKGTLKKNLIQCKGNIKKHYICKYIYVCEGNVITWFVMYPMSTNVI